MNEIEIKVKLQKKEWLKLNFIVAYTSPIILILTTVGICMISIVIMHFTTESTLFNKFPTFPLIFGIYVLILLPIITLRQSLKNLKSNKWVSQELIYTFKNSEIMVDGETFNFRMNWSDVFLVRELNDWFIVFTEKNKGLFIPKNRFENENMKNEFKKFLIEIKNVNKKLK